MGQKLTKTKFVRLNLLISKFDKLNFQYFCETFYFQGAIDPKIHKITNLAFTFVYRVFCHQTSEYFFVTDFINNEQKTILQKILIGTGLDQ